MRSGGSVWHCAIDSDPLVRTAPCNRQFCSQITGRDMRSRRIEERAVDILELWEARKDISLEELRLALAKMGLVVAFAGLHRFFVRRGMTRKRRLAMPSSKIDPMS